MPVAAQSTATDIIQRTREAFIAIFNAHADIAAVTGKPDDNVVPWRVDLEVDAPVLVFFVVVATQNGQPGDTREIMLQVSAYARSESEANAMLEVVENRLTVTALAALPRPLDAMPVRFLRRPVPFEESTDRYRGDLEITLIVTK